jgi:hypothetical protein
MTYLCRHRVEADVWLQSIGNLCAIKEQVVSITPRHFSPRKGWFSLGAVLDRHGKSRCTRGSELRTSEHLATYCTDYGVPVQTTNTLFNSQNEAIRKEDTSISQSHFIFSKVFLGTQVLSFWTVQSVLVFFSSAILSEWPAQFRAHVFYFVLDVFWVVTQYMHSSEPSEDLNCYIKKTESASSMGM